MTQLQEAEQEKNLKYGDYFDPEDEDEQRRKQQKKDDQHEDDSDEDDAADDSEADEEDGEEDDAEDDDEDSEPAEKSSKKKVQFDLSRNTEETISPAGSGADESEDEHFSSVVKEKVVEEEPLSAYEQRQEELRKALEIIQEKKKEGKPWQMMGEVDIRKRPKDSLLDENLDFDLATRPAPAITQETTVKLEEIIIQRIRDQAFDDVVRKQKPVTTPQEFRKELVLNQEKSKESLAQIYEKEYLKAVEKSNPEEKEEVESKEKQEIRRKMKTLFAKLDALANYHYTPKPAEPELKIITNTPAISMEEVAPLSMSDANLLAPEEVKTKPKGEIKAKEERTKTDKNRARRQKKKQQRQKKKLEEEKESVQAAKNPRKQAKLEDKQLLTKMLKNKRVEKMKVADESNLKSTFFSRLQEKTKATSKLKTAKEKPKGISAKFMKL